MKSNAHVPIHCFIALFAAAAAFVCCSCSVLPQNDRLPEEPTLHRAAAVSLETKETGERNPLETRLFREMLETEAQQNAYDTVAQTALNVDTESFTLADTAEADLSAAVKAFLNDYPEVFWVDPMSSYQYYENDGAVTARLRYLDTGVDWQEAADAFEEALASAVEGAPFAATDYEMELYLHDWLTDRCKYVDDAELLRHTAYGALVQGEAVCDGYARAFQLLCRQMGIEATVVEGTAGQEEQEESGHMWNCVQPGGVWYHVDVTWDDTEEKRHCEIERYFYFNLSDEAVARTHTIGGGDRANLFVPVCDSSDLNYLRLNCTQITDPEDDEQAVAALIDAARRKQGYCVFQVAEGVDLDTLTKRGLQGALGEWMQSANLFLDDPDQLPMTVHTTAYSEKRIWAIIFQ